MTNKQKIYSFIDGCIHIVTEEFDKFFKIIKYEKGSYYKDSYGIITIKKEVDLEELKLLTKWVKRVNYQSDSKIDIKFFNGTILNVFPVTINFKAVVSREDDMKFIAFIELSYSEIINDEKMEKK